jgi:hypothetical protein
MGARYSDQIKDAHLASQHLEGLGSNRAGRAKKRHAGAR